MYIGEQLINPTEARLRLSAQLGSQGIIIDSRPNIAVMNDEGLWDGAKVAAQRRWIEGFGLPLKVMALDVGAILLDSLRAPERADARHVRTSVPVNRRQPAGMPIRPARTGGLGHPPCKADSDRVPVEDRQPVEVRKVPGIHDCSMGRRERAHLCRHSCPLSTAWAAMARSLRGEAPPSSGDPGHPAARECIGSWLVREREKDRCQSWLNSLRLGRNKGQPRTSRQSRRSTVAPLRSGRRSSSTVVLTGTWRSSATSSPSTEWGTVMPMRSSVGRLRATRPHPEFPLQPTAG